MKVPFVDLKREIAPVREEILGRVADVVDRTRFILGPQVRLFEEEFSAFCGARYGVGVASGTDALMLALIAAGVREGDEVVTAANTFIATFDAITRCGATPVPVDPEPEYYTIDAGMIEGALTEKSAALLPVHLYGQASDMDAVMEIASARSMPVVEDAAQAHGCTFKGRRLGSIGSFGCFSFYPSKNLGAFGDGGMLVTSDAGRADTVRFLRNYGQKEKNVHLAIGFNSRLDEVQAAVLRVKLAGLELNNAMRREAAARYRERLADTDGVAMPLERGGDSTHVYHLFVIRCSERDRLKAHLEAGGVSTGIHYPAPPHLQPAYGHLGYEVGSFPVAERLASEILSLPMFPGITEAEIEYVCGMIGEFYR